MSSVLVDTTVWIDALNGKSTWQVALLEQLIDVDNVVLCPVIVQEILQGIRLDHDFNKVKENLSGFNVLLLDPVKAAVDAASLYRKIRKQGVTIRKSNDCLIATYAIAHRIYLLHNDADFTKISQYSDLIVLEREQ